MHRALTELHLVTQREGVFVVFVGPGALMPGGLALMPGGVGSSSSVLLTAAPPFSVSLSSTSLPPIQAASLCLPSCPAAPPLYSSIYIFPCLGAPADQSLPPLSSSCRKSVPFPSHSLTRSSLAQNLTPSRHHRNSTISPYPLFHPRQPLLSQPLLCSWPLINLQFL